MPKPADDATVTPAGQHGLRPEATMAAGGTELTPSAVVRRLARVGHLALRLALTAALLVGPGVRAAEKQRPFGDLAGSWAGRGTIDTLAGAEHAVCDAAYQVSGKVATLSLRCTTESYRLNLSSAVVDRDGVLSGTWSERDFGTSGTVSGRADGNRLGLAADVAGAQVTLVIATQSGRQTVTLRTTSPFVAGGNLVLLRQT